jgi:Ankyrin repeats (many copies)
MKIHRRNFIATGLATSAALALSKLFAEESRPGMNAPAAAKPALTEPDRGAPQDHELVKAFVGAGHGNFEKVKEMVAKDPKLVLASWDRGGGDWESALQGAAHTGHREIALYLLAEGARIDAFCSAMLGQRDVVLALLKAEPATATTKGPHGISLLYHAAIGGDVEIAKAIKPFLPPNAREYNGALTAAARDGRLAMTKWLLENGVTNVNAVDGFKKTSLKIALEKGFSDVADELRRHGGRENI